VGQLLRYELTLTNTSPNVAHAVQLADVTSIVAQKARRVSYPVPVPSTPNCSRRSVAEQFGHRDALVCDLGDLGPGETKDISYELTPTRDGDLNNGVWAHDNGLPRGRGGAGLTVVGVAQTVSTQAKVILSDAPLFDEESATGVDAQGHGSLSAACQRAVCDVLLGVAQSDISVPRVLRRDRATVGGARKPRNVLGTVRGRIRGHKRGHLKLRLNRKGIRRLKRAGRLLVVFDGTVRSGKRHAHVRMAHILKLKP
jgi:hypothetical protein